MLISHECFFFGPSLWRSNQVCVFGSSVSMAFAFSLFDSGSFTWVGYGHSADSGGVTGLAGTCLYSGDNQAGW